MTCDDDVYWMRQALLQAQQAFDVDEVPIGSVLVHGGELIAAAHNRSISDNDPSAHAEVCVLREAGKHFNNYRLQGCTLYVTLEPCAMCAMALLHARVGRVVFGAKDDKTGAAGSVVDLFANTQLNHQTDVIGGVLAEESADLLKRFFAAKRQGKEFPLRDDALRTAEERFEQAGVSSEGFYIDHLPSLNGLRLHYQFSGGEKDTLVVCVHDGQSYSEQFAQTMPLLAGAGYAVLAPDLIGFGRSDKPKKMNRHTVQFHAIYLLDLLQYVMDGRYKEILLIGASSCAVLLDAFVSMCEALHLNIRHVCVVGELPQLGEPVKEAPFSDQGYRAALKAITSWGRHEKKEYDAVQWKKIRVITPQTIE